MAWDAGENLNRQLDEEQLGTPEPWYWCLRHNRVEQGRQCPERFLLGPFPTAEAASHALESVDEHNKAWDAQDQPRRPEGPDDSGDSGDSGDATEGGDRS
ncbi:hypothetical protein ABH940_001806 [Streptacidiphilus sp. BW17]|uniref:hypothetical protein n=1 Tax=Streptacidiphilus sp. BW17 TaxID=3156274 RepID=UPI003510F4D6